MRGQQRPWGLRIGLARYVAFDLFQDQRGRRREAVGPGDEALPGLPAGDGAAGGVRALRVPRQSERRRLPSLSGLGGGGVSWDNLK